MKRLAIDPGDKHVGWVHNPRGGVQLEAGEWRPTNACNRVTYLMTMNLIDELVLEEFALYDKAYTDQTWSRMQTSQLIGAFKWIAYCFRIPVVEQGAYIKNATRNQLRARHIVRVEGSVHTKDAELHWWYRTLREGT